MVWRWEKALIFAPRFIGSSASSILGETGWPSPISAATFHTGAPKISSELWIWSISRSLSTAICVQLVRGFTFTSKDLSTSHYCLMQESRGMNECLVSKRLWCAWGVKEWRCPIHWTYGASSNSGLMIILSVASSVSSFLKVFTLRLHLAWTSKLCLCETHRTVDFQNWEYHWVCLRILQKHSETSEGVFFNSSMHKGSEVIFYKF